MELVVAPEALELIGVALPEIFAGVLPARANVGRDLPDVWIGCEFIDSISASLLRRVSVGVCQTSNLAIRRNNSAARSSLKVS